jgi:hypothetical protein
MSEGEVDGSLLGKLDVEGLEDGCFDGMSEGEAEATRLRIAEG